MPQDDPNSPQQPGNDGFTIDEEFKNLLPPLNATDFEQLEASLLNEGCRDRLIVWKEEKILVDGHHRYAICKKHGLPFNIIKKSFADRETAIEWMVNHQKSRRNMHKFQWAEVILKLKPTVAARAKANQRAGGGAVRTKSYQPVKTIEKLAKMARMGSSTLRQVAFILKHADQRTISRLRKGDPNYSINGVWEELQERMGKEKTRKSVIAKSKQRSIKSAPLSSPIPTEPPQDLAGHIIAALEELERQYPDMPERIDLYNTVGDWANKKKIELALSQK